MLDSSPIPQTRLALAPCTNTLQSTPTKPDSYLATPPTDNKLKRRNVFRHQKSVKRLRLPLEETSSESENELESDEDIVMEDTRISRARNASVYQSHTRFMMDASIRYRRRMLSTVPTLQTFISSNKADVFKCQSIGDDTYLTPPYSCAYSHGAKRGKIPYLAVATEQGTVHILNTSKRNDWDCEPPRKTLQPHNNGIFDVRWSEDDASIATCSGDQSTRISDVETGVVTHLLRGHSSTVKCMNWDPSNPSLLATGGRDGTICLWDLRLGQKLQEDLIGVSPTISIYGAHDDTMIKSRPKARKGKQSPTPRTITNVLYSDTQPLTLVSSSSFDGTLRSWDLRMPNQKRKTTKQHVPQELNSSFLDPTSLHGSKRPRGIISLASGIGPSAGLIFALGADSRIHIFDLPTLSPHKSSFSHPNLNASSFYVGLSISPCGKWLASGGSTNVGNSFLFDIENAWRPGSSLPSAVELRGQVGEVGAVDWAEDMFATCTDDGTVRTWRPNPEIYTKCHEQPDESQWDWRWSV